MALIYMNVDKNNSHKARQKMGKKVKGETFSVLLRSKNRLKPNIGLGLG